MPMPKSHLSERLADHILIINRGQVAGYGTHDELAATSTVYKQILASQEVSA